MNTPVRRGDVEMFIPVLAKSFLPITAAKMMAGSVSTADIRRRDQRDEARSEEAFLDAMPFLIGEEFLCPDVHVRNRIR